MNGLRHRWIAVALTSGLLFASALSAQEAADDATIYRVEPVEDERLPGGRSSFLQGTADAAGDRFLVEGTQLLEPISVRVEPADPGRVLRVRIVKDDWTLPERDDTTQLSGKVSFNFRTYDGFKFWITADEPTDYRLVVWIGDEIQIPLPAVVVPASEFPEVANDTEQPSGAREESGEIRFTVLELLLIVMLLSGGGVGAFLWLRRKSNGGSGQ